MVFLDLANASGSVPHEQTITPLVNSYFEDLQLYFTIEFTTSWQLETGIAAGCTISKSDSASKPSVFLCTGNRWVQFYYVKPSVTIIVNEFTNCK